LICTLLLIACGGSSSTGLYMSIIALGLCYFAYAPISVRNIIQAGLLTLLIILPNLFMLGVVKANLNELESKKTEFKIESRNHIDTGQLKTPTIKEKVRPTHSMYWLFGDNRYLAAFMIMFLATFMLTALSPNVRSNELRRLYLVLGLVAFSHPLAYVLSKSLGPGNLIWRFHWALPMSIIFSLFSASILNIRTEFIKSKLPTFLRNALPLKAIRLMTYGSVFFSAVLFLLLSAGHLAKSYSNKVSIHKVNKEAYSVAQFVVNHENKNDVILASKLVAQILPMLERGSELVTSRPLYWSLPYFSVEDIPKRKRLQYLINNMDKWTIEDALFINAEIQQRHITTLIFPIKVYSKDGVKSRVHTRVLSQFLCSNHTNTWVICHK